MANYRLRAYRRGSQLDVDVTLYGGTIRDVELMVCRDRMARGELGKVELVSEQAFVGQTFYFPEEIDAWLKKHGNRVGNPTALLTCQGTIVTLTAIEQTPAQALPVIGPPTLEQLKAGIGGGYIEEVPMFNTYRHNNEVIHCVAFCDEEGKLKGLPLNRRATVAWHEALLRGGHPGLRRPDGHIADVLVGDIIIVFGNQEFMRAL